MCGEERRVPGATAPWIETLLASPDANSHDHAGRAAGGVEDNADPETPGGDTRDDWLPPDSRLSETGC
jgi:hypothetical protein